MPKKNKLFLVIFLVLIINDICKYIHLLIFDKPRHILSFDFVVTRFDHGTIFNLSIIYLIFVSLLYFCLHFFDYTDFR